MSISGAGEMSSARPPAGRAAVAGSTPSPPATARRLNGVDLLAVTKLDVLDELDEILLCTGYRYRGEVVRTFPADLSVMAEMEPVYRRLPGWKTSTQGTLAFEDLPVAARDYLAVLEEEVGAPVGIVSTGPRREETLFLDHPDVTRLLSGGLDRVLAHRDG